MQRCQATAKKFARSRGTVLITGALYRSCLQSYIFGKQGEGFERWNLFICLSIMGMLKLKKRY